MDNQSLCLELANSESESDVIGVLKGSGYWDKPECWEYFGGIEDNYSSIGNQQESPERALVEKIVNSVDAVLMSECLTRGVDPEGARAPQSVADALKLYFSIHNGRLSNLDAKSRSRLAENIGLVATGAKNSPCYTIVDKGEGQTPDNMPRTLLGLFKSIKVRIPFVQGKFHMGGTGALRFGSRNKLQLTISKRHPKLIGSGGQNDWGFTIVRREDPSNNRRSSVYTYLAPDKEILRFQAESLPLLPGNYPNKFGVPLEWGTFIKLYEYNMRGLKTNILFDPYNALSLLLPHIALPVRLYERRQGFKGNSFETTLSGLSVRLDEDKRENIEAGFPSSHPITCLEQQMTAQIYAFKKNQIGKYRRNEGIIFVVNGQSHGAIPATFFNKASVDMSYLRDSILVILDCSNLDGRSKEDLFMTSRDRLGECELKTQIESKLAQILKNHPGLRELRVQRRQEAVKDSIKESKALNKILQDMVKKSPPLARLFGIGKRLSNPFKLTGASSDEVFKGKRYPTYFKLVNKAKGKLTKNCPENWRFRVTFETDANNDYFDRDNEVGAFTLKANGQIIDDVTLNLWNGIANLTACLPKTYEVGDSIEYISEVQDSTQLGPFRDAFDVIVISEKPHVPGSPDSKKRTGKKDKGKDREIASLLDLPKIIPVRREQWDDYKFDDYSALAVLSNGDGGYDYFVNVDNICLLTELKNTKLDAEVLTYRFQWGMALIGLAMLEDHESNSKENDDSSEDIFGNIKKFTKAISPILLPMIAGLSDIDAYQPDEEVDSFQMKLIE
ncbi:hypothetical protein ACFLVR_04235 [Chloroflexota bacterium]